MNRLECNERPCYCDAVICAVCGSDGHEARVCPASAVCAVCNGSGVTLRIYGSAMLAEVCLACGGSGKLAARPLAV